MSFISTIFIFIAILAMIIETTPLGRYDVITETEPVFGPKETVSSFLGRSQIKPNFRYTEILVTGYFFFDIVSRMILCPDKLEFFSDSINWVDIIATFTSFVGVLPIKVLQSGHFEAYLLFLKLPRILRLFKVTESLRSGIGAFTLTIAACIEELKLVFVIIMISTIVFGILVFSVEISGPDSLINNVSVGMWWAIVSMSGVGFGDYFPKTSLGYMVGAICIVFGLMICQMPITIYLKNFSIYYNQASARLISQSKLLLFDNVDKSEVHNIEMDYIASLAFDDSIKKIKHKKLISIFK